MAKANGKKEVGRSEVARARRKAIVAMAREGLKTREIAVALGINKYYVTQLKVAARKAGLLPDRANAGKANLALEDAFSLSGEKTGEAPATGEYTLRGEFTIKLSEVVRGQANG
ncbi:MAG TPA: hypothetical protein P5127_00105 [Oscillospiraceae bacterium]|jgi:transposase|nr:hypothetical protein [Oscillospiraceae bacterium]